MDKAEAIERDADVLRDFVGLSCRRTHRPEGGGLCPECQALLDYAVERRRLCPHDPKPACRKCATHCYREPYREKIRAIMKAGAMHYVTHGRVDKILKLALGRGAGRHDEDR